MVEEVVEEKHWVNGRRIVEVKKDEERRKKWKKIGQNRSGGGT